MESRLDLIMTTADIKADAGKSVDPGKVGSELVVRYQKAIRNYLAAILRRAGSDSVEEAYQDLYLTALDPGLGVWDGQGRFRDFLKKAVRRVARRYQGKRPGQLDEGVEVADPADDHDWDRSWRDGLMRRALEDLDAYQRGERVAGRANNYATLIRLIEQYPGETGPQLAARLSMSYVKFRKDLSRARRKLAEFLRAEVRWSEPRWTDSQVDDELRDLGLGGVLRAFGKGSGGG
jgi:DNA-directed RNA polymerase specialized sigma24 family protein